MYNYYYIESLGLKSGETYVEEICEVTFDLKHFIKVGDLIPGTGKDKIEETRKVLLIEHKEGTPQNIPKIISEIKNT